MEKEKESVIIGFLTSCDSVSYAGSPRDEEEQGHKKTKTKRWKTTKKKRKRNQS